MSHARRLRPPVREPDSCGLLPQIEAEEEGSGGKRVELVGVRWTNTASPDVLDSLVSMLFAGPEQQWDDQ